MNPVSVFPTARSVFISVGSSGGAFGRHRDTRNQSRLHPTGTPGAGLVSPGQRVSAATVPLAGDALTLVRIQRGHDWAVRQSQND